MQVNKKKLILIGIVLVIVIAIVSVFVVLRNKKANEFYYEFKYDDNLITQSVWVYDGNGELQTDYYLFYNNEPITYTEGEKAVLVMLRLDLKDHPTIQLKFKSDLESDKSFDVNFKEE